jgi:hypothetical protein
MKSTKLTLHELESRIALSTYTVMSSDDSGTGSLRAALALADSHPGKDTIVFKLSPPPAHGANVITLTTGPLTCQGNVTITGPGAGKLIINAQNKAEVIEILDGNPHTNSPATITGLSVVQGFVGIDSSESLTLKDMMISENRVGVSAYDGQPSTTVSITDSVICDNHSGGGIDLSGLQSFTISRCTVQGNAEDGFGDFGGGIHASLAADGTSGVISQCTVAGNHDNVDGGGLVVVNSSSVGTISINSCTIVNNKATLPSNRGGGGGISATGKTTIANCLISNNVAGYWGGGIEMQGPLKLSNCTITGNQTTLQSGEYFEGGGGVASFGSGNGTSVVITGCRIDDNHSVFNGGGVLARGLSLTVKGCSFTGNTTVQEGGGIYANGTGANKVDLAVTGSKIVGNQAPWDGAAIAAAGDGAISISNTNVTGNSSTTIGGVISLNSSASVTIQQLAAIGNVGNYGGALLIEDTPSFQVSGGRIAGNSAAEGAGIDVYNSSGSIRGTTITANNADDDGGGVLQSGAGTVSVQIGKITGNTALTSPNVSGNFTFI